MDSAVWPLTADRCFCWRTRRIPQYLSGHLYRQMHLINERTQMDNTHKHTQMRTASSCCAKLQCVYQCSRLRFITVHTQTVAVFLCQCLMRGWESGDLTAVRSSCSLELPPVPIRSLKTLTHTRAHTCTLKYMQARRGMQTRSSTHQNMPAQTHTLDKLHTLI